MSAAGRTSSPKPKASPESKETKDAKIADKTEDKTEKFELPPRPAGLQGKILKLYGLLAVVFLFFVISGESMKHPIPEGKFEKKDGTIINIKDFDPVELGPFPKCHEHFEHHAFVAEDKTTVWRKNNDAPNGGPFPVGHPENPEWEKKADKMAQKENAENRFRWKGLQPQLHLLFMATIVVLLGCLHGVWLFTEANAEDREEQQSLKSEDAYWFPVIGSCVLFGLFCVIKYLGKDILKWIISTVIVFMCCFGIGTNVNHMHALVKKQVNKPVFMIPIFEENVTVMQIAGSVVGAAMAVAYVMSQNWIINNLFGVSFCLVAIKAITISSYRTGAIMLVGLFAYDVFWVFGSKHVFGSNVMVTVATGLEAPIKLMFPRNLGGCGDLKHSMLGLGDIAVPGLFIAFLAKFDAHMIGKKGQNGFVYLNNVMVAYVLSLVTTVSIMLFFNAAQPALLYIVPFVLIASHGTAVARGETKLLWGWFIPDDEEEEKKEEEKKDK